MMTDHFRCRSATAFCGAVALSLAMLEGCSKKSEDYPPPPVPEPASEALAFAFDVAELSSQYGVAVRASYQPVQQLRHEPYRVAVLATWCPYSLKFLEEAKNDPSIAADYLLVVYEDEFARKVRSEARHGNIDRAKAEALLEAPENRGRMLVNVEEVLKFGLPIYVVRAGEFDSKVQGFPTRLSCSSGNCKQVGPALSEMKALVRQQPELLEEIKQSLPPAERARAERDPESLITALAISMQKQDSSGK